MTKQILNKTEKRQELIKHCRCYKGEETPPESLVSTGYHHVWYCERQWVRWELGEGEETPLRGLGHPEETTWQMLVEYTPQIEGQTPTNLLRFLFYYFCYYAGIFPFKIYEEVSVKDERGESIELPLQEAFKLFYRATYLKH